MTLLFLIILSGSSVLFFFFFFQAEDGIRDTSVTGVQTCALPILRASRLRHAPTADNCTHRRRESGRSARSGASNASTAVRHRAVVDGKTMLQALHRSLRPALLAAAGALALTVLTPAPDALASCP